MKTRIKKLIDEHVIQPLANAITNRLQKELTKIMDGITEVRNAVNDLKQGVADEHARIDARLDELTKKLEEKGDTHQDQELTDLAAEIRGVTSGLSQFHPTVPADQPAGETAPSENAGGPAGDPQT